MGIDLDAVRERAEDAFGPGALENTRAAGRSRTGRRWGHIPFDAGAKTVVERSLREAVRRGDRHLGTEHLLLGLVSPGTGLAREILAARGIDLDDVRAALDDPGAASG